MIARDERIRAIAMLLVPGFVGHTIQLLGEDTPWRESAELRYFTTPGWHLALPPLVPIAIAVAFLAAVIAMAVRRTRPWLFAVAALYALHYVTYPYRIRNHMTLVLGELTVITGVWLIGRASGAVDLRGRGPRALFVDRHAMNGAAAVLCVTYVFAALHKLNWNFLAFDEARSSAVQGLTTFWIYGDLGSVPPRWAMAIAIWGTIVIEAVAPVIAWRFARLRVPAVLVLFAFHFPHVAVMDVADYPMLASAFYPALFSRGHFHLVLAHARRPNAYNVAGAALGIAGQLWFIPWLGSLTGFGVFVMALWGWAAGAMIRMNVHALLRSRASRIDARSGRDAPRERRSAQGQTGRK